MGGPRERRWVRFYPPRSARPATGVRYANVDDSDFGVNIDPDTGELFGLAWGDNSGWVNLGFWSEVTAA